MAMRQRSIFDAVQFGSAAWPMTGGDGPRLIGEDSDEAPWAVVHRLYQLAIALAFIAGIVLAKLL